MHGFLHFHAPCFDGVASAALLADFLRARGWATLHYRPVNYDLKDFWLSTPLPRPSAVVDFLFHPDAAVWADHHATAFLTAQARSAYESRPTDREWVYDDRAPSCAGLLWRYLLEAHGHRAGRFANLVRWAEKIDAARYESVEEAFAVEPPALRVQLSLSQPGAAEHCVRLVEALQSLSLDEVAALPEVALPAARAAAQQAEGLQRLRAVTRQTPDGVVLFDLDADAGPMNRYAPFRLFPDARYSLGVTRGGRGAKVTAMRNPWREFPCAPLGQLCAALGGGGHARVGSIVLPPDRAAEALAIADRLLAEIRTFH